MTLLTDAGLASLVRLHPNLKALDLGEARHITPKGIAHLATLTKLQELTIDHAEWSEDAFRHLEKLPLRKLRIRFANIRNGGFAALARLRELTYLDLVGCRKVTDQGFRKLATSLSKLQHFDIGWASCGASDETLIQLAYLPLVYLGLASGGNERVSDVGVGALIRSETLKRVVLPSRSRVTPRGLKALRDSGRRVCTGRRGD